MTLVLPAGAGRAEPKPSAEQLKAQAEKLGDQLEQLTEQYNGAKVRLTQARRAAKVAAANAERQAQALETVRERVGEIAATSYMNGGVDQAVVFAASQDPQVFLDQASTLQYFATRDGAKAQALVQAMQAAQRAGKAAEDRADEVHGLRVDLDKKRSKVEDLYTKVRDKLVVKAPDKLGDLPAVAGSGKGAQAVKYALTQLGVPYSWGGGTASGPSYGIAQGAGIKGFDCSGLTMYAYAKVGINLPHFTGSQWNAGTHVSRSRLQPGDLVFFYSDRHHMGMYIGGGKMVHAPQTGDVIKISPIADRPWAGAVRVA
ncbi:MAG TPA: NlpC/P60 family protein [Streptosporangiaceae bacterium]|nr:NlpC/P60 family protein [Streptosporangiaceae bacterium]